MNTERSSTSNDRVKHINAINDYAWNIRLTDVDRAAVLATEAFAMAEDAHYVRGMAEAYTIQSVAHIAAGEYDRSILLATEAIQLFDLMDTTIDAGDRWMQPYAVGSAGEAYFLLSDYDSALTLLSRQLTLGVAMHDRIAQSSALRNLGRIYAELDDHESALRYFEDAVALATPEQLGDLYNLCAQQALALARPDDAIDYADTGLRRIELYPHQLNADRALLYATLAEIAISLGQHDSARSHLESAWRHSQGSSQPVIVATLLMQYGKLQVIEGDVEAAIKDYQRALALSRSRNDTQRQYQCHEALAALFEATQDYASALLHHKTYSDMRRRALSDQTMVRVQQMEMLMRTRISQQEARFYEERTRELEDLRRRDRAYFDQLSELKDEMMRTASHDLKNPLATVLTVCYLLRQHQCDEKAEIHNSLIGRIEHQVDRMKTLIGDLLDLARLETGRAINLQQAELLDVMQPVIEDMEPMAESKAITIETELLPVVVPIDPPKIRQVMDNLLSNAIKYTPDGGHVIVQVMVSDDAVTVDVSDTGIGIPKADLPNIFERFYRVSEDAHLSQEGTGLGLAIVKSIVEQHGGDISVESTHGAGTTFRFRLPLRSKVSALP